MKYFREKKTNPVVQKLRLQKDYPLLKCSGKNGKYTIKGCLQPTEMSLKYYIKIIYIENRSPKVYVTDPPIQDDAPHIYPEDGQLCLYWPEEFKWNDYFYIGDYIIPWTSLWLYFYEIWLVTGVWYGDEAPHGDNERKIKDE